MDFEFTDDQHAIADMAGSVFADYCTDDRLRQFDTGHQAYMEPLWELCIETGLQALAIPEAQGGEPHSNWGTIGVALGFVLMMVLDVVFG